MIGTLTFKTAVGFTALMALLTILPGSAVQLKATELQAHLTKKEVEKLTATAKTPEEHLRLSQYFTREADRLDAESREHEKLAEEYRNSPSSQAMAAKSPMGPRTAAHCEFFAKATREAADKADELAASHLQMARVAGK